MAGTVLPSLKNPANILDLHPQRRFPFRAVATIILEERGHISLSIGRMRDGHYTPGKEKHEVQLKISREFRGASGRSPAISPAAGEENNGSIGCENLLSSQWIRQDP